jgi:predicted PurR-regulated permease PerM
LVPAPPAHPNASRSVWLLGSIALVVASLYWAQAILIPFALAILLTFILTPAVAALQRRGLGRVPAVVLVVALVFALLGGIFYVVFLQVGDLITELPKHRSNIKAKLATVQGNAPGGMRDFLRMFQEIQEEVQKEATDGPAAPGKPEPLPVKVQSDAPGLEWLTALVPPALTVLAGLGLMLVLLVFMLIQREELRNRLIRLAGKGHVTMTTRALDEAGQRISRYLLMLVFINGTFGLAIGLGLFLIGLDYAFLWGILAASLRFLPYVGPWAAAFLPISLSVASSPGWTQPLLVIGLFVVCELLSNNLMEPYFYGPSVGVWEVALLVAVAFWTWLWGPIGLVLSTPLTACLVVLARYVPPLEFLDVLLGHEPVLDPPVRYYQRLLARDQDEATDLVEEFLHEHPLERVYDELLLPALLLAKRERERGELAAEDERFFYDATREILEDPLATQQQISRIATRGVPDEEAAPPKVCIFGCPARSEADELALQMFQQLLEIGGYPVEVLSAQLLTAEMLTRIQQERPAVVCIAALPPGELAHTRYLCKRLRAQLPDLKIVVGRWGQQDNLAKVGERLRSAGADQVAASLRETRSQVLPLVQTVGLCQAPSAEPDFQPAGGR